MRHVLFLALSISLVGCIDEEDNPLSMLTSDRDKLLGTWYISADDLAAVAGDDEDLQGLESFEVTYSDDGSLSQEIVFSLEGLSITVEDSGTWTLDGSTLTQKWNGDNAYDAGETYEWSAIITDAILTLTGSDSEVVVFRKKEG
ncbi:MAG: hypothetical protein ACPGRY_07230 [Candidatus Latescibacterota bacterium]